MLGTAAGNPDSLKDTAELLLLPSMVWLGDIVKFTVALSAVAQNIHLTAENINEHKAHRIIMGLIT